ncbi:MAG TPA: ATP-binding cassette domain-containing protein [Candidatus Hungatella pullicola]|nr:ATP-binding cassette domain-containing protein [Candidatus Hungatella pullicola]
MLQAEIKKKLREFTLDLSFQAGNGCLGILGPSGCGKSMTLKSIAGIVTPDEGNILLNGKILFDSEKKINQKPQKRKVGYLFQNYALFPNMTVEQNVMAGLGKRDRNSKKKTAAMIKRFRLEGLEKRYPGQLSGGQQQRAALARILAYEPDVILLDEPFSAMDAHLKEGLKLELEQVLKEYEGTAVLVTHDRDEAYQLCDHLMLLDSGKVMIQGETRDLFAHPVTCHSARLTGCKNISRAVKTGDHQVKALDWGVELTAAAKVEDRITAVGVRAHDFQPVWEAEEGIENLIPVQEPIITEMPFEWYITLKNGLWWKTSKSIHHHSPANVIPPWLYVPPEAVLLLEGELE